jgi:hypothetical protein
MKINDLFRSLEIFRQYFDEDNEDRFEIDYDLSIAIDKTDRPLSPEDYKEIRHLGWYQLDSMLGWPQALHKLEEYDFKQCWFRST